MTTINDLPDNISDAILVYAAAKRQTARPNIGRWQAAFRLSQVSRRWRAIFMASKPGNTLQPFHDPRGYRLGLRDQFRRHYLRSASLSATPHSNNFDVVLPNINLQNLQTLELWESAGTPMVDGIVSRLAGYFTALLLLRLQTFLFEFTAPTTIPLTLLANNGHNLPSRCQITLNSTYHSLTSLCITDSIAITNLGAASPSLKHLQVFDDGRYNTQHTPAWPLGSLANAHLPLLKTLKWVGDHWGDSIATFPAITLHSIKELTITMSVGDRMATMMAERIPLLTSLQTLQICHHRIRTQDALTSNELYLVLRTASSTLSHIEIPIRDYDVDIIISTSRYCRNIKFLLLETSDIRNFYDLARIRATTSATFHVRQD
ncbi:hypothetical protein HDV00_005844, partial [Rhizophlyctis rosea]